MAENQKKTTKKLGKRKTPKKPISRRFCERIITGIQKGTIDPKTVKIHERRECIIDLLASGWKKIEIAEFFDVNKDTIRKDCAAIFRSSGEQLYNSHILEVAGEIKENSEAMVNRALKETKKMSPFNAKLIADIRKDTLKQLQSIGVIPEAPTRISLNIEKSVHELTEAELSDEIARRKEKIKQIEAGTYEIEEEKSEEQTSERKNELQNNGGQNA